MISNSAIKLAVIGGSGFDDFETLENTKIINLETPYGLAAPMVIGQLEGDVLLFMPRHGSGQRMPPHMINYRANLWALKEQRVQRILAVNAVGSMRDIMAPGRLVLPNQLVDYTQGREHTFFTGCDAGLEYIDFTEPYDRDWRNTVLRIASRHKFSLVEDGVYACTQGPRLETAAEIQRLIKDGCDLVGMTGMPEAALARELQLPYAALAVVVNWAAGLNATPITVETVYRQLEVSIAEVKRLIGAVISGLNN
ncbi:MAG: S-methyl-5'-thioinosine phosphorylase [Cellvibrionaceae bacterium]